MKRFFLLCSLSVLALTFSGCGYSATSALPSKYRTIYVEPFKNKVSYTNDSSRNLYLPLLEVKSRNAIVNRYLFDGNLRIGEPETADLVLKGELVGYNRQVLRTTDNDDVQEYRVVVSVNLLLWDATTKEVWWEEKGFAGEGDYYVRGPVIGTEEAALEEALLDLGRRVVERTVENW